MQSPLLGFNNNVRHRGRLFHIQTEDSGVRHPHVITHLFMDGGRVLKSVKTSYAEEVGAVGMVDTVRALMKQQHKSMFIALRDGTYDPLIDREAGSSATRPAVSPSASSSSSLATPDGASANAPEVAPAPGEARAVPAPTMEVQVSTLERAAEDSRD